MRYYTHLDPRRFDAHPAHSTRARIGSAADVREWLTRTGQATGGAGVVTATFIIDLDGWLWVADRHSEHLACAAGRDVLSAGEMTFELEDRSVAVTEVSNHSLGYCPEPDSWPAVARALDLAGIEHPGCFTSEFVFRRCRTCGATNVVKDGWYECGVCGSGLSRDWNFAAPGPTAPN